MSDHSPHPPGGGHEPAGVGVHGIVTTLIALFGVLAFAFGAMLVLQRTFGAGVPPQPEKLPPQPSESFVATPLNADQLQQRLETEARQKKLLTTYGWIDPQSRVARIPIERAMQLTVERYGGQP